MVLYLRQVSISFLSLILNVSKQCAQLWFISVLWELPLMHRNKIYKTKCNKACTQDCLKMASVCMQMYILVICVYNFTTVPFPAALLKLKWEVSQQMYLKFMYTTMFRTKFYVSLSGRPYEIVMPLCGSREFLYILVLKFG